MSRPRICCSGCGDDEASLIKRGVSWICDECEAWNLEADNLDLDEYEQRRRERLAEAQEC